MKSTKIKFLLLALSLILLAGGTIGVTLGRYIHQTQYNGVVTSPEFFFESDILKESGKTYELNPGAESVTLSLMNHIGELQIAPQDVYYVVSVTNGAQVNGVAYTTTEQKLNAGTPNNASITISQLQDGKTYQVTAVGYYKNGEIKTFVKVLTATFTVKAGEASFFAHLDTTNDAYVELTLMTKEITGDVSFQFPAGLIPDEFNTLLSGIENYSATPENGYHYGSHTVNISGMSENTSYKLRFYKEKPGDNYTLAKFKEIKLINGATHYPAQEFTP